MPQKIISARQMAEVDTKSIELFSLTALQLMEQAGSLLSLKIKQIIKGTNIKALTIAAGGGHNGGDGFVIARQLYSDFNIQIALFGEGKTDSNLKNLNICRKLSIPVINLSTDRKDSLDVLYKTECIIDCLTGTGLNSKARPNLKAVIKLINESKALKISVDIPSGLIDNFTAEYTAVKADHTIYINFPKSSFFSPEARTFCGTLHKIEIGFPKELLENAEQDYTLLDYTDISSFYRKLEPELYKYSKGKLAVFAGGRGTSGAAALASSAGLNSGCGVVKLYTAEDVYPILAAQNQSVMTAPDSDFLESDLYKVSAFCAGPGWGKGSRQEKIITILAESGIPGVFDADGIGMFASGIKSSSSVQYILTPHPGEFRNLYNTIFNKKIKTDDIISCIKEAASFCNCIVVYKSHITIIAAPDAQVFIIDGMFSPLGTAGSGDILTGLIGGFLGRGFSPVSSAICGVLIHLNAAKKLFNESGFFTSDLLNPAIARETALYEKK